MNLVMATVIPASGKVEDAEAEPIVVELDGVNARLMLDDGSTLVVDRQELVAQLDGLKVRRAA